MGVKMEVTGSTEHVGFRCQESDCLNVPNVISEKYAIEQDVIAIERDDYKIGLMIGLLLDTIGREGMHVSAMVMLKLVRHMTQKNFQDEERIMIKRSYSYLEAHINEHHKLLGYLDGLIVLLGTANDEEDIDASTVSQFITEWHAKHVSNADGALIDYLRGIDRQPRLSCPESGHG